jgi:hypothetical protein
MPKDKHTTSPAPPTTSSLNTENESPGRRGSADSNALDSCPKGRDGSTYHSPGPINVTQKEEGRTESPSPSGEPRIHGKGKAVDSKPLANDSCPSSRRGSVALGQEASSDTSVAEELQKRLGKLSIANVLEETGQKSDIESEVKNLFRSLKDMSSEFESIFFDIDTALKEAKASLNKLGAAADLEKLARSSSLGNKRSEKWNDAFVLLAFLNWYALRLSLWELNERVCCRGDGSHTSSRSLSKKAKSRLDEKI